MRFPSLHHVLLLIASCGYASLLTGCASVVGWNAYDVAIDSTPTATEFVIRNKAGVAVAEGVTPAKVKLGSSAGFFKPAVYTISANDEGTEPTRHVLRSRVNPAYYVNFLFGALGLPGALLIDPMTGALYSLPTSVKMNIADAEIDELDGIDKLDKSSDFDTIEKVDAAIQKSIYGFNNTLPDSMRDAGNSARQ